MSDAVAAERAQAAATERAIADERTTVARELHDLVAHGVTGVTVQAAAARSNGHGGAGDQALAVIEAAGRRALADLRQMLVALRDPDAQSELAPAPGLPELEALVVAHRAAHGPVRLVVDPAVAAEPESLRLTTYRLVQEALTNVGKHAPGSAATVMVCATHDGVSVLVEDEGCSRSVRPVTRGKDGTGGYGLVGMRERVALFRGSLTAEDNGSGGFRVFVRLHRQATT